MGSNYIRHRNISNCVRELAEDFGMLLEDDTKGWASDSEREAAEWERGFDGIWASIAHFFGN